MNPNAQFERDLEQWLQAEAPASAPAEFHASVMDRARTLRQRPGWTTTLRARRFSRGRGITLLAAASLLLVGGALAAGSGVLRLPSIVPPAPAPSFGVVATASPEAASPSPSEVTSPSTGPTASPVTDPAGVWIATGTMGTPRIGYEAVRLLDGRVLVLGGERGSNGETVTSNELYDPVTGTWSATGRMIGDGGGTATVLHDGKVLVAGDSAQLYDPESGTWAATGQMIGDGGGTATLLHDGKVLVAGDSAQLYDPDSGTWTETGTMTTQCYYATHTLLPDGRVLVACGYVVPDVRTDVAELYDPSTGSWTATANMPARFGVHTATLLRDGKVLVAGAVGSRGGPQIEMAVYDPATGAWTVLPARPSIGYEAAAATLLSDGRVLMTGLGFDSGAAELYDPSTGSWTTAAPMLRSHGTPAISLLDGTVLVAGGDDYCPNEVCVPTGAAELYVPAGVSPPALPAFPSPPPPVFPSPTPSQPPPAPLPPEAGPIPPNARSWTITVENESSEPATMFVAEGEEGAFRLVGSATPNVVPAGTTVQVTFLFPAKAVPDDGWITVNPRLGDGADVGLVGAGDIGIAGQDPHPGGRRLGLGRPLAGQPGRPQRASGQAAHPPESKPRAHRRSS